MKMISNNSDKFTDYWHIGISLLFALAFTGMSYFFSNLTERELTKEHVTSLCSKLDEDDDCKLLKNLVLDSETEKLSIAIIIGMITFAVTFVAVETLNLRCKQTKTVELTEKLINSKSLIEANHGGENKVYLMSVKPEARVNKLAKIKTIPPTFEDPTFEKTYSILFFPDFQNLLLSHQYIEYFTQLASQSKKNTRIIIVDDGKIEYKFAFEAFIQLSDFLGIDTYVYKRSQFYKKVESINKTKRFRLTEILESNAEIRIPTDEAVAAKVRYLNKITGDVDPLGAEDINKGVDKELISFMEILELEVKRVENPNDIDSSLMHSNK